MQDNDVWISLIMGSSQAAKVVQHSTMRLLFSTALAAIRAALPQLVLNWRVAPATFDVGKNPRPMRAGAMRK